MAQHHQQKARMMGTLRPLTCARLAALSRCLTSSIKAKRSQELGALNGSQMRANRVTTSSLMLPVKPISENQASVCSHKVIMMVSVIRGTCVTKHEVGGSVFGGRCFGA